MDREHRRARRLHGRYAEPELLRSIQRALNASGPIPMLVQASSLIEATTPDPWEHSGDQPSFDMLLESFIGTDRRETTGALAVWAEILPDEETVATIRRELASRSHQLPRWLRKLDQTTVSDPHRTLDLFGDFEHVTFGVEIDRASFSFAVLIDHNSGTVVADGFPVDGTVEDVLRAARHVGELEVVASDPRTIRADLTYAIEHGMRIVPPYETEAWPQVRPLLSWLVRLFPPGEGTYDLDSFEAETPEEITDEFLGSTFAAELGAGDRREAVETILRFACGYGRYAPYGWSTTRLDIFVNDWYPRKIYADRQFHAAVAEVLPRYIEFAHDRLGVPEELSRRVVELAEIVAPGLGLGSMAMPLELSEIMLDQLAKRAGDWNALEQLDAVPLPDEPMDWTAIGDAIRPAVAEVLEHLDAFGAELESVEYRTAFRRALARAARGDPDVFTRKGSRPGLAAAIAWVVGKGNELFDSVSVGDMNEWFGLRRGYSVQQRGQTVRRAMGLDPYDMAWAPYIGADLLVASVREDILRLTDYYQREDDDFDL